MRLIPSMISVAFSAVLMTASCALSAEIAESDWERFDLDSDHTSIEAEDKSRRPSAIPQETQGDIVVPEMIKGFKVVSLGNEAFSGCSRITSVVIPEGVTNIAESAFRNCSSLTNVVFPSTLVSIGKEAFYGCDKLASFEFEGAAISIGEHAFCKNTGSWWIGCQEMTNVSIKADSVSIANEAFCRSYELEHVSIVGKNIAIEGSAFYSCSGLATVSIDAAEVSIGSSTFSSCSSLATVTIDAAEVSIGSSAFSSCSGLATVSIDAAQVSIGYSAFSSCSGLATVTIDGDEASVGENAFRFCSGLESIHLPTNVAEIAYRAFDGCSSLTAIELPSALKTIADQAFYGCSSLIELETPKDLSKIGSRAFEMCSALTSLRMTDAGTNGATSVQFGERAFFRCTSLTNALLTRFVDEIGSRAFSECESLSTINLPTNLTVIAESTFESCSALRALVLPETLQSIGNTAFYGCSALDTFSITTNNIVEIGVRAFVDTGYWNDWPDDSLVENNGYILGFKGDPVSVTLPEACREIPVGMFEGKTNLVSVVIPDGLVKLGSRAFAGSGVRDLSFENTQLTSIGVGAFEGCTSFTNCVLPGTVTSISDDAFLDCSALLSFHLPPSVESIGASAFRNCTSLVSLSGGEGVSSIGSYAFSGCTALLPFRFPEGVVYGNHVFQGVRWTEHVLFPSVGTLAQEYPSTYSDIRTLVFSSGVTNIPERACAGAASLEWVHIPESVDHIGAYAFSGCSSLTGVVISAGVGSVGSNAFENCFSVASLEIPGSLVVKDVFPEIYDTLSEIRIAHGSETLVDHALEGCRGIRTIDIPWTVTSIGAYAFAGCSNIVGDLFIPEYVGSIGSYAFKGCTGIDVVRYLCDCPQTGEKIYYGTKSTLISAVLRVRSGWKKAGSSPEVLPSRWPQGAAERRIAWWVTTKLAKVTFAHYNATGASDSQYFLAHAGREVTAFPEDPSRDGYEFLGWFTEPYGGVPVEEGVAVGSSVTYYAHWECTECDETDDDDDEDAGDCDYDFSKASVFNGYLLDGDSVAGTIEIKISKGRARRDEEMSATMKANMQILGEGKITASGTFFGDGFGEAEHSRSERIVEVGLVDPDTLEGVFGEFDIVAFRNVFSSKEYADKARARAAIDDIGGNYTVVLACEGSESPFSRGYIGLALKIGSKGKTKVTGVMPDGTKVSATAQLLLMEEAYRVPVVAMLYSGKRGGFGFYVDFELDEDGGIAAVTVDGVSEWTCSSSSPFTEELSVVGAGIPGNIASEAFFTTELHEFDFDEVDVAYDLSPDNVSILHSGSKWILPKADTVRFVRDEGYEIRKDNGNPAGLKLSYNRSTGVFKGSFKVFGITEAGRSKKFTANVNGVVLDGVGYGTALIKKTGSVAVSVESN